MNDNLLLRCRCNAPVFPRTLRAFCKRKALTLSLLVFAVVLLTGTDSFGNASSSGESSTDLVVSWVPGAQENPQVPSPTVFLGRPFAQRPSSVESILGYARLLAAKSDRVELQQMGTSTEGDPLLLLVISSEENQSRLTDREARMELIADPRRDKNARENAIEEALAAVWVVCSVHGDEASGSDAGLALAYHLAADESEATRELLSQTVVLINPCANPDGRRRFLSHLRSFTRIVDGGDPQPAAVEHQQFWPGGRFNHNLFDLNRDWALLTQSETRAQVAAFRRWKPQVVIDLHEMGFRSTYFFPPSAKPINPLLPETLGDWLHSFGKANAEAFDAAGLDYYSGEDFDLFYPGYGDTWPSLNGAVGMTYEQATTRGLRIETPDGRVRSYADAVHGHFVAALTTCRHAARKRRELLHYFGDTFDRALEAARKDHHREIVLDRGVHPAEARRLAHLLSDQGVEVYRTEEETTAKVTAVESGSSDRHTFAEGSFLIPLRQPAYFLVRSLLDLELPLDGSFLDEEQSRHEEGLPARFYDVTAWSLALSHGLEIYQSHKELDVPARKISDDGAGDPMFLGETQSSRSGDLDPSHAATSSYGYLFPYRDNSCPAALAFLWRHGVKVHCAREKFRQGGIDYPAGSLVVKRSAQDRQIDLDSLALQASAQTQAEMHATASAWTAQGPSLGSNRVVLLKKPKIAVAIGPGVNPTSVGSLLWVLEKETGVEVSAVRLDRLEKLSLRKWDVLVLPDLRDAKPLPGEKLKGWVELGGTLVAEAGAIESLMQIPDWLKFTLVKDLDGEEAAEGASADSTVTGEEGYGGDDGSGARRHFSEGGVGPTPAGRGPAVEGHGSVAEREQRLERTPGAILRLELARHHFLNFGSGQRAFSLALSDRLLRAGEGDLVASTYDEFSPRVAGFVWPSMEGLLGGHPYALSEAHGRGKVVVFAEEPAFRGSWPVTERMLLNAVLWGPSLAR